jgi:hypothetical protein
LHEIATTGAPEGEICAQQGIRIICLLPFIMLVRLLARHDPHFFRYWDVTSMEQWRRSRLSWMAYAISLVGWAIILAGMYFLVRWAY